MKDKAGLNSFLHKSRSIPVFGLLGCLSSQISPPAGEHAGWTVLHICHLLLLFISLIHILFIPISYLKDKVAKMNSSPRIQSTLLLFHTTLSCTIWVKPSPACCAQTAGGQTDFTGKRVTYQTIQPTPHGPASTQIVFLESFHQGLLSSNHCFAPHCRPYTV